MPDRCGTDDAEPPGAHDERRLAGPTIRLSGVDPSSDGLGRRAEADDEKQLGRHRAPHGREVLLGSDGGRDQEPPAPGLTLQREDGRELGYPVAGG